MTNTPVSNSASAQHKILNSLMRDLVRAVIFFVYGGDASLSDIRYYISSKFDEHNLPRNWKVQVRDVLKHDPDIEKTEDDTWVLRTPGFEA